VSEASRPERVAVQPEQTMTYKTRQTATLPERLVSLTVLVRVVLFNLLFSVSCFVGHCLSCLNGYPFRAPGFTHSLVGVVLLNLLFSV
jgi:hypothetical protein